MEQSTIENLASYVKKYPIIYINHFDFKMIDEAIAKIGKNVKCVEFNNAFGIVNFEDKSQQQECDLEGFFRLTFDDTFLILKDVHEQLNDPKVVAHLKKIAENRIKYNTNKTVFILSETLCIPKSLEHYIGVFDIPLPSKDEIEKIINNFIQEKKIKVKNDIIKEIAPYFKGLNEFQINQILKDDYFDINDKSNIQSLISKEKEQFIKKSGILELINFPENIDDIGGLDNLKDWLRNKAKIFADIDRALEFGIVLPKGIMIIGIPGCGKSLTAKVTASLFKIPLVRLDIGFLLGKYVGESEENMRKALKLSEAISPCVLWIDEIEKAFAGVGKNGGGEVTNRLFGHLLNWIQENKQPVFIVATANDISKFPPEFLRKGRFDELFFVDLPNGEERKKIFEILLKKPTLDKWNKEINFDSLIEPTDGFSGADLESVVKNTIERVFIENKDKITTEDLLKIINETEPISKTHKDKIEEIRKIQNKFKKANSEENPVSIKSQKSTQQEIASTKQEQEPIQQKQTPIIKQENYIEVALDNNVLKQLEYEIFDFFDKSLKKNEIDVTDFNIPSTYNYNGKNYKITSIGKSVFEYCESLKSVTIPNSVTSIGESAFKYCKSLKSITIPNSVTSIGKSVFEYCEALENVTIPNSVTSIGEFAFANCKSLTSVTIPDSVTEIEYGDGAFYGCELLINVIIPNSITEIGKFVFSFCKSLENITIPNSVIKIMENAFRYCQSLKNVIIPNSVITIGKEAFWGCSSLTCVMIPNSVKKMGKKAFSNCTHLTVQSKNGILCGGNLSDFKDFWL